LGLVWLTESGWSSDQAPQGVPKPPRHGGTPEVWPFFVSREWAATAPASTITMTNTAVFQLFCPAPAPPEPGEQQSAPPDDESQEEPGCSTENSFVSILFYPYYGIVPVFLKWAIDITTF